MRTVEANSYNFTVDTNTDTTIATGELQNEMASRNSKMQVQAGGESRLETDQGGHLVAAVHNGPAIRENLFAQDSHLNQSQFKVVENAERSLIANKDSPASIYTERTAYMSHPKQNNGARPDAFMINDTITYANGNRQEVHLSFSNMTVNQQENINQELERNINIEDISNPNDELRNSMTSWEYADLMVKTDTELPELKQEFEEHITNENLQNMYEPEQIENTEMISDTSMEWDFNHNDYGNEMEVSENWGAECEQSTDVCSADVGAESSPSCDND